jgi:hypothetical protein
MIVKGMTFDEVALVVRAVSATKYAGNIEIRTGEDRSTSRTSWAQFTLRTRACRAGNPGAAGSSGWNSSGRGPYGLRSTVAACWHAHYDVIEALLRNGAQRVDSGSMHHGGIKVRYTPESFHADAIAMSTVNVGSRAQPRFATELCECSHWTGQEVEDAINERVGREHLHGEEGENVFAPPTLAEWARRAAAAPDPELGKYASHGAYANDLHRNGATV